jgi:hypothetical protein
VAGFRRVEGAILGNRLASLRNPRDIMRGSCFPQQYQHLVTACLS